jgi:hypothetical protein
VPMLVKYPRTRHLHGSRLQPGDEDLDAAPWDDLAGRSVVVEEKLDGANAAVSFDAAGRLWLQSRGHFLTGGPREKHFHPFKQWATSHATALRGRLGDRFVMYGEWLYAKHTVYYDRLPHYFLEFDVLDTATGTFLSTPGRRELLGGLPVVPVPVLWQGTAPSWGEMLRNAVLPLIGRSCYKSLRWKENLAEEASRRLPQPERVWKETDGSDLMEGLYVKDETNGTVAGRFKYVRADFLTAVLDSGGHWLRRPVLPNRLDDGVDLFAAG